MLVSMATGEIWSASLFDINDCRGVPLEVRPLEPAEVKRLKSRQDIQIQMEKYIIDVSFGGSHENYEPPLKLAKFKPPSAIIPQIRSNIMEPESEVEVQYSNPRPYTDRSSSYNVTDSELDEIWGPKPPEQVAPIPAPAPRPRPMPQSRQEMFSVQHLSSSRPLNRESEYNVEQPSRSHNPPAASHSSSNYQRTVNHQPTVPVAHVQNSSNTNSAVRGSMLRVSSSIWD